MGIKFYKSETKALNGFLLTQNDKVHRESYVDLSGNWLINIKEVRFLSD